VEAKPRYIEFFRYRDGRCPFAVWVESLPLDIQAAITKRLDRVERGLLGDCKPAGGGITELRLHDGPGYRIFVGFIRIAVIVLIGCDKTSQKRTIPIAKALWKEYKSRIT